MAKNTQLNASLRKKGAPRDESTQVVLEVNEKMEVVGAKIGNHELFFLHGLKLSNAPIGDANGAEKGLPSLTLDFDTHLQITGFCKV